MPQAPRSRRRRDAHEGAEQRGRVIPFQRGSSPGEDAYEPVPRPLRRAPNEWDEGTRARPTDRPFRRRPRSRIQRNAISILGVGFLVGLLLVGYGLMRFLGPADATAPLAAAPTAASITLEPAAANPPVGAATSASTGAREIQASVRVLEPSYTVKAGDTLNVIAEQFNTTAQRVQALNDLADPRALKVGQKLVIPPPL